MKAITKKVLLGTAIAVTTVCVAVYSINSNDVASAEKNHNSVSVPEAKNTTEAEVSSSQERTEISDEERAKELYNNPPTNVNGQTENQTR